jgi:hypothetical protein
MSYREYSEAFLQLIKAITRKRPKIVAEHILEHGSITTEELATLYGYKHPPRAARDLREEGIPLQTFRVKNSEGRTIAAYRFDDPSKVRSDRLSGRKIFPKKFKHQLIQHYGPRCAICRGEYEALYLQIDHRVPYEVVGDMDSDNRDVEDYMLLCGECNRAKSWSCEHCPNWLEDKRPEICLICYWAKPEAYKHIALRNIRRVDLIWSENEIELYERLKARADALGETMPDYVKKVINYEVEDS